MPTSPADLRRMKQDGKPFLLLTCYDFLTARILDQAGVPMLLVGDSLGIYFMGLPNPTPVTMDAMVHHCRAVSRAVRSSLLVGDLPFGSYEASVEEGVRNAIRLVKEGGVSVVKLEGAETELVAQLAKKGIPTMGHLSLGAEHSPSSQEPGREDPLSRLLTDAHALEDAGACALLLQAMPSETARQITRELAIPTVGIGAGPHCDGQAVLTPELLGLSDRSPYCQPYIGLQSLITDIAHRVMADVSSREYPEYEHSYDGVTGRAGA